MYDRQEGHPKYPGVHGGVVVEELDDGKRLAVYTGEFEWWEWNERTAEYEPAGDMTEDEALRFLV